jgi:hypothetical protein
VGFLSAATPVFQSTSWCSICTSGFLRRSDYSTQIDQD